MESKMISFSFFVCLCAFVGLSNSSAIPMWEYLSKQEKMSYLYSLFANQVEIVCDSVELPNCNYELKKYGSNKLKDMTEDHLDAMDPYQRGANAIIWESMMEGHKMVKTTPKPRSTTTAKPNSYDDESFSDDFEFGATGSASARIDNVYRVPPPKGFVFKAESGTPLYTYPHNVVPYLSKFEKPTNNIKIHGVYNKFQSQHTTTTTENPKNYVESIPLTGPMVVRVYPDGTPVKEDQVNLPQDEDLRQYKLSKIRIPNF